jgi:hypothetical protein
MFHDPEPYVPTGDDVGLARVGLLKARALKAFGRQGKWCAKYEIAFAESLTPGEWTTVEEAPVGQRRITCPLHAELQRKYVLGDSRLN